LGITQLQQALAKYTQTKGPIETSIRLLPYQLRPETSETPFKRNEYMRERFGAERADAISQQLRQQYKAVGLEL
jgi:predicted DsbA family dithiol-disulfide isomerase